MEPDFASSDPFDQLGIPADADKQTIRRAYKALVRQYRPETHPDEFQQIRTAYEHALSALAWREQEAIWEQDAEDAGDDSTDEEAAPPSGPMEDADFDPSSSDRASGQDSHRAADQDSDLDGDPDEDLDEEEQVFTPIFDKPWPEDDEPGEGPGALFMPGEDSKLAQFLGYAAWTDEGFRQYGIEIEALLAKNNVPAAYRRFEELEALLEDELGDEQGRLTWLRLGTFLARSLAAEGTPEVIDKILRKVDNERDLDEECFEVLEFAIMILRARAEVEKASRIKYPNWFTDFVFANLDADPSEINVGLADLRRRLLSKRKKRDIDWLDDLGEDLPNFGTLFHILMYRHSEGLLEIMEEGEIRPTSGEIWKLADMGPDLDQLELQLESGRPKHVILNSIVGVTFGACALGFLALWLIGLFSEERFDSSITLSLLAVAWLLRGAVDRSYAYRFLVRPKLRRFLARHEAPVALLTGLIRMREGSLPGLDYYLPAIETDPKLPPRHRKRDVKKAGLPYPYLGNLAPR